MKIEHLALRSFRSFVGINLNLNASKVYICGRNGSGKSSIKTALRWALTGVCDQTDGRGVGWQDLAPEGSSAVKADVQFSSGFAVEREYDPSNKALIVNKQPAEITVSQNAIYSHLRVEPAWLTAVLETGYFVDLAHADAKALVLSLLDVKVDVDMTPLAAPQNKTIQKMTLEQVQAAYKDAYSKRAAAKVALKNHVVPPFQEPEGGEMPTLAEVREKLAELRKERETLIATSGNIAGQREAAQQELKRLRQQGFKRPAGEVPSDEAIQALQNAITAAERELDAAVQELAAVAPPRQPAPGAVIPVADLKKQVEVLMAHQPGRGCVLDGEVSCDTAKIRFTNRAKKLREQIDAAGGDAFHDQPVAEAKDDVVGGIRSRLERLRGKLAADTASRNSAVAIEADNAALERSIAAAEERLAALTEDEQTAQALELLSTRISKGEMFEDRCSAYWRDKERHQAAVAKREALQQEVAHLEALVEQLGPKGAMVVALAKAIGDFADRINFVTAKFGWTVRFEVEPWLVWVNNRPLSSYSESQRFRIGIAVQLAVAALSGLGFVVVDRLDMLDTLNRAEMTALLLSAEEIDVQQVIILATRDEDMAVPQIPGMRGYRLGLDEQGSTQVLEEVRP